MNGKLSKFIQDNSQEPKILNRSDLDKFLYSMSESNSWPDYIDTVSKEQAILCWRIIESLKNVKMPEDLKI